MNFIQDNSELYNYSNTIGEQALIFNNVQNQEYENTTEEVQEQVQEVIPQESNDCENLANAQEALPNPIELQEEEKTENEVEGMENDITGFDNNDDTYSYTSDISVESNISDDSVDYVDMKESSGNCNLYKFLLYIGVLIVIASLVVGLWDYFALDKVAKAGIKSLTGGSEVESEFSLRSDSDSLNFKYFTENIEKINYMQ